VLGPARHDVLADLVDLNDGTPVVTCPVTTRLIFSAIPSPSLMGLCPCPRDDQPCMIGA
jgi:hypothetical protein